MNRENFRRPLLYCATGAYVLYCIVGIVVDCIPESSASTGAPGVKSILILLTARMWPYPMVDALGWRISPEPWVTWLVADLGGLALVVLLTLLVEAILGVERRKEIRFLIPLLVGLAVVLLTTEFAVVAVIRAGS
jgi:hypothetical protein